MHEREWAEIEHDELGARLERRGQRVLELGVRREVELAAELHHGGGPLAADAQTELDWHAPLRPVAFAPPPRPRRAEPTYQFYVGPDRSLTSTDASTSSEGSTIHRRGPARSTRLVPGWPCVRNSISTSSAVGSGPPRSSSSTGVQ